MSYHRPPYISIPNPAVTPSLARDLAISALAKFVVKQTYKHAIRSSVYNGCIQMHRTNAPQRNTQKDTVAHDYRIHGLGFQYTSFVRFELAGPAINTIFYLIASFEVHYTPVLRFAQATILSTQAPPSS